ncbi:DnaD domain protein [Paenibacillus prosopidis]|uniref:DNA replication protein n=1 Tax=Paenibacillus prosopidis TaxID=630520 RepID=A0A368W6U9_9BACL|nr:DnaD domain protein [Paenibacillus prosopidis]RCW51062.1 DNA replication protein [Paenibacillus prosopidis]
MNNEIWKAYSHGMAAALQEGGVHVSAMLLRTYRQLELSDTEAMLLLQIMVYMEADLNDFPTPEELADRMGISVREVGQMLGRLMKDEFLTIDEYVDSGSGKQSERYNWNGWLLKAAQLTAEQKRETRKAERQPMRNHSASSADLFSVFEQEFGRLLSPMECETITGWLDQDRYTDEIIRFALKEAVFAGKLSLRYIDRILIEWSRNRVTNADEARAHAQKFRGGRG